MKKILLCLLLFIAIRGYGQQADTSEIYFDVNAAQMSTAGMRTVDSLRFSKIVAPGHKTMIYGFADYLGNDDYNKALTAQRAKNVKEYLVSLGMDPKDIIICEGKGRIVHAAVANEHGLMKDRKVTIITDLSGKGLGNASKTKKDKPDNANNGSNDPADPNSASAKAKNKKTKSDNTDGAQNSATDPMDPNSLAAKTKTKKTKNTSTDSLHNGTANPADPNSLATKTKTKKTKTTNADSLHNGTTNPADPNSLATKTKTKKTKTTNADSLNNGMTNAADANSLAAKTKVKKTKTTNTDSLHNGTTNPADPNSLATKTKTKKTKTTNTDSLHNGTTDATDPNSLAAKTKTKKTKTTNTDSLHNGTTNPADPNNLASKSKTKKTKTANTDSLHNGTTNPADPNTLAAKNKKTKTENPDGKQTGTKPAANSSKTDKPKTDLALNAHQSNMGEPTALATSAKADPGNTSIEAIEAKSEIGPISSGAELPKPGITPKKSDASNNDSLRPTTKIVPRRPEVVIRKPEKDIPTLNPAKLGIGEIVPLNDIYFAPTSDSMLRQSEPSLERLYKFLKENSNLAVEIEGRICCLSPLDGTDMPDGKGSTHSTARAKNIYEYLVGKGIEKRRITYIGLGNTKPTVYPERDEHDRGLNRRPVMKIIRK